MEVKRRQFHNGMKLLSVIDRLSCENEDNYRLIPQGVGSKKKDDKPDNTRTKRKQNKTTNMNSKYAAKLPEKRVLNLKENALDDFYEVINSNEYPYTSYQTNKKGFPIPADVQFTLKPGIPKGVKPSMCFCKPPTTKKSKNENGNQKYGSGFNSEINRSKKISRIEGNGKNDNNATQKDYSQFYLDILSKESSRTSVIQYASCSANNNQSDDNQIWVDDEQTDNKQTGDKQKNREHVNAKQIDDKQIGEKQNSGKQKDETLQVHDKQINNERIDYQIGQQNGLDGQQRNKKTNEQQSQTTKRSSLCGVCLQEFPSILSLQQHRKENGHYLCSECGEALKDDVALGEHIDKKLCKKAVCIFCGQKFVTRDELENHKATAHHKCLECNKLYNSAEKLLAHNERHHGAPYTCLQCGEEFPTHALCKKHALNRHKKKKYNCPECGRGFTRMNLLTRHATYTHSDERNFQCEICSRSFKRPDALKTHMITHSDSKPFHCEKCGKQFSQKICYTKHLPCKNSKNKTKSIDVAPPTMVDELDIFDGEPRTLGEHLDKLSENNLIPMFENASSASLGGAVKKSDMSPVSEEMYMGCRCPPTCKCKQFSIGLKMQVEEPKGPTLDSSEEVASLSCCCDIGLDYINV